MPHVIEKFIMLKNGTLYQANRHFRFVLPFGANDYSNDEGISGLFEIDFYG
jgi:hypothetical protein